MTSLSRKDVHSRRPKLIHEVLRDSGADSTIDFCPRILILTNFNEPFSFNRCTTNTLHYHAVLQQKDERNTLWPTAYASRIVNQAETNYSRWKKTHYVAIVWSTKHTRQDKFKIMSGKPNDPGSRLPSFLRLSNRLNEYLSTIQDLGFLEIKICHLYL